MNGLDPFGCSSQHDHDGRHRPSARLRPRLRLGRRASVGLLLLLSGVVDTPTAGRRGGAEGHQFGAFYDSTLDRVGDGATFIGIGAFLLTAPDDRCTDVPAVDRVPWSRS